MSNYRHSPYSAPKNLRGLLSIFVLPFILIITVNEWERKHLAKLYPGLTIKEARAQQSKDCLAKLKECEEKMAAWNAKWNAKREANKEHITTKDKVLLSISFFMLGAIALFA